MQYSVIKKSQLEGAKRLDAEYYQRKIADLVRQSHEARKQAKQLLEAAKLKVEQLIEKGAN